MNAPPWHAEHWSRLQARRERGALPHALLLCGAQGLGKRAFARRFVQGLLCLEQWMVMPAVTAGVACWWRQARIPT